MLKPMVIPMPVNWKTGKPLTEEDTNTAFVKWIDEVTENTNDPGKLVAMKALFTVIYPIIYERPISKD